MTLRRLWALAATTLGLAASAAFAQQPGTFATISPPQPADGSGKIEVIEFFWYGCPHCYALEPAVNNYVKNLPKDVVFRRVPATPGDTGWGELSRFYYTLEAMGQLEQLHQKAFDAIHKDKVNLGQKSKRDEWLAKNGVDPAKYAEAEKSFTVATKFNRAKQLTYAYKVDSVPRLVVNGKYYTAPELAGSSQNIFPVVDQLIAQARKETSAPTAKK
jgi:thiol:disulfide interchange protein DsbA